MAIGEVSLRGGNVVADCPTAGIGQHAATLLYAIGKMVLDSSGVRHDD